MINASGEQALMLLSTLHDGRAVNKIGSKLAAITEAVHTTGLAGRLDVILEIIRDPEDPRICVIDVALHADIPVSLIDPNQDPLPFPDWDAPATDGEVDHRDPAAVPLHDN